MLQKMYETDETCFITLLGCLKQAPIHYACGFGHLDAVKYLLSKDKKQLELKQVTFLT